MGKGVYIAHGRHGLDGKATVADNDVLNPRGADSSVVGDGQRYIVGGVIGEDGACRSAGCGLAVSEVPCVRSDCAVIKAARGVEVACTSGAVDGEEWFWCGVSAGTFAGEHSEVRGEHTVVRLADTRRVEHVAEIAPDEQSRWTAFNIPNTICGIEIRVPVSNEVTGCRVKRPQLVAARRVRVLVAFNVAVRVRSGSTNERRVVGI